MVLMLSLALCLFLCSQYKHGLSVEDSQLRGRTLATSPDQAHI